MSDKSQPQNNESPRLKPGQLLKQARERLGLEQKDIASQLNLQVDTIDAVENDSPERLPAPTYVRGYIRSYARMVRLNGDELIKLYENDAAEPPEIIPDIRQHHQITSHDKPVKTVTYLITLCLVLLLIAWLQSHYVVTKPVHIEETVEEITVVPPAATNNNLSNQVYYYPDINLPDHDLPATQLPAYPEPGTDSTGISVNTEDQIIFTVKKESWVEVYDTGNNRLYLGTGKSGEEIKITGVAPFNVLLGNAPGVAVTFNGKMFDTEPYSKGGVAKFILSNPEHQETAE